MKTTRRIFLGLLSALTLTAKDAFGFFRKKEEPKTFGPPPQGLPHRSVCYVYNAGMDFEGVSKHTFGQMNVIKGGVVTKITQGEEQVYHEPSFGGVNGKTLYEKQHGIIVRIFGTKPRRVAIGYQPSSNDIARANGLLRTERIIGYTVGRTSTPSSFTGGYFQGGFLGEGNFSEGGLLPGFVARPPLSAIYEDRFVVVHPALETSDSLVIYSRGQIIPLPFWNNKEVDLEGVNALISADTFRERISKTEAIAKRRENWAYQLSQMCMIVLEEQRERYAKRLTRDLKRPWGLDTFEQRACHLLEWTPPELAKQTILAHIVK